MRADLEELLSQTLLFTARPQPKLVQSSFAPRPLNGGRPNVTDEQSPSDRNIWEFELSGLDGVRHVTVRDRTMRDMRMSVCSEVRWGEVKITYQGRTIALPLTDRFLLRTYYLADGRVPESDTGYWQLPMSLDQSFQRLFGFQLAAGQIRGLTEAELDSRQLMAPPSITDFTQFRNGASPSPPLRILVCMALGCAKERNDFEPGGLLGVARLIPHVMLVANLPVEHMEATIQLARHPTTAHSRMGNDEMSPRISPALFTDRNHTYHPYPRWDNLFDYYWTEPTLQTEMRVVRRDRPFDRERDGIIKAVEEQSSRLSSRLVYKSRPVKKVPRQGEFDNIHLAPKMKLPTSILQKLPGHWPKEATMAPFCVHDCFHIHWRWGKPRIDAHLNAPKWVRGWQGDNPYREAGAPMVPPNQDVSIKLLEPTRVAYTARIHAPVVGRWQVVMHHGAAYALSYKDATNRLLDINDALTTDLRGESRNEGEWANFYWHLRYALSSHPLRAVDPSTRLMEKLGAQDSYAERLSWDAGGFRAARDL